jgi:hypothetical protein
MKPIKLFLINLLLAGGLLTGCTKMCNKIPAIIVNAGPDQTIQLPASSATLTGTVTQGQDPTLVYTWSEISGPNTPVITNGTTTTAGVTGLILGTYIFQFQAENSAGTLIGLDTTKITVTPLTVYTLTIQPGRFTGEDASPYFDNGRPVVATELMGDDSILDIEAWTFYANGGTTGGARAFMRFTALDTLPSTAVILSANLSLYAATTDGLGGGYIGDSYYPGSPYNSYGDNSLWLQRVTGSWDQTTIDYNNQPATTAVDEVAIPASTSRYNYSVANLDVTQLVQDMKATPNTNYGFCMRLQTEAYYRSMSFDASESKPDSSTSPKLVITYTR